VIAAASSNLDSLLSVLGNMQRMFERIAGRLSEIAEEIDAAAAAIEQLRRWLSGLTELPPLRKGAPYQAQDEHLLRKEAKAGVTLTMDVGPDGSAEVSINGRPPFHVPPQPASLLEILATPRAASDSPAGWSTKVELASALSSDGRATVAPAGVARLVHKLRKAISDARENVFVIQTNRRLGAWRVTTRSDRP
jgi:hypothetical protein